MEMVVRINVGVTKDHILQFVYFTNDNVYKLIDIYITYGRNIL